MSGENVGRLDVFTEDIEGSSTHVWRLAGDQSTGWNEAQAKLVNHRPFKVRDSAVGNAEKSFSSSFCSSLKFELNMSI